MWPPKCLKLLMKLNNVNQLILGKTSFNTIRSTTQPPSITVHIKLLIKWRTNSLLYVYWGAPMYTFINLSIT